MVTGRTVFDDDRYWLRFLPADVDSVAAAGRRRPGDGRLDRPGGVLSDAQRYADVKARHGFVDAVVTRTTTSLNVVLVGATTIRAAADDRRLSASR